MVHISEKAKAGEIEIGTKFAPVPRFRFGQMGLASQGRNVQTTSHGDLCSSSWICLLYYHDIIN